MFTTLMLLTLAGCENKEPIAQEETIELTTEEEMIVGGFVDAEDGTLTDELKEIFIKATDGLLGASYEPVELVATQVVAGTNYKFLANGTKTTNPITKGTYYVTIYKDLQGNVSILDIETIEEKQEQIDLTTYDYWIVFYNPDGNELQRTAEKYGSTPKYVGDTPVYWDSNYWYKFIGWTDKYGNDIEEFEPITGNKYIYAKYEIGGRNIPAPQPTPAPPYVPNCTMTDPIAKITDITGYGYRWILYVDSGSGFVEDAASSATSGYKTIDNLNGFTLEVGKYYHVINSPQFGIAHLAKILSECETPDLDHGV